MAKPKIHKKQAKLPKPDLGFFARNEISFLGAPSSEIQELTKEIIRHLGEKYKVAFVDQNTNSAPNSSNNLLPQGLDTAYITLTNGTHIYTRELPNSFQTKQIFNSQDLVLVNGNHFDANQQIIIIDSSQPLNQKLEKLTNVIAIIYQSDDETPSYLKRHIPNFNELPIFRSSDLKGITEFIDTMMKNRLPALNGLVLSGGKSERMKRDKTMIDYHGKTQREFMVDILTPLVSDVFVSIREEQKSDKAAHEIVDRFVGFGPFGAILTAMMSNPNRAWLVTAVDQPFLKSDTLDYLIKQRNSSKVATAFYNPETNSPEPLVTIWEPRAYPILLHYLSQGYPSPLKVLINSDIELVKLEDASVLDNVNTPEQYEAAVDRLRR